MPTSEDEIRRLIADGKIRVDGSNVYADPSINPPLHASREQNAAHIAMLRRAYHMFPREDANMPTPDPYIESPNYVAGGSAKRLAEQNAFTDQWGDEMEDMARAGFAPTRAMRAMRDTDMRPSGLAFRNLSPEMYAKSLGLSENEAARLMRRLR